jgi:hypothetical protein
MRRLCALLLFAVLVVGCGEKKEDPTKRPGFQDTSDPSKIQMLPPDAKNTGKKEKK